MSMVNNTFVFYVHWNIAIIVKIWGVDDCEVVAHLNFTTFDLIEEVRDSTTQSYVIYTT